MTLAIRKAKDIELKNLAWLLYGRSGSGKTTLIGTFPAPIFHIGFKCERGVTTLRGHPGVDYIEIETAAEMTEAFNLAIAKHASYRTIAIDSLTSLIDILYRHTRAKRAIDRGDWLDWRSKVYEMAERLSRLPVESVYTATQAANVDEATGARYGGPNLFASLEAGFPAKMEVVALLECETDTRGRPSFRARLSGGGLMIGRVRGTMPPGDVAGPTYARIMEAISEPLFGGAEPKPLPAPDPEPAPPAGEAAAKGGGSGSA